MMDISDGLASDLCHILKQSGCGACIDVDAVPAAGGDVEAAVCGGEDYKLLYTVCRDRVDYFEEAHKQKFGCAPYRVGEIISSAEPKIRWVKGDKEITPAWRGFSHF